MRALLFTTGSPFARAVRITLHELNLDYERREEITTPSVEQRAAATPTLQVPTFWDGPVRLWESGTICDYLLETYPDRPQSDPPLAPGFFRHTLKWHDKLVFSTIQTFGTAATTISQFRWTGIAVNQNAHLQRSGERLSRVLQWLEEQLDDSGQGFIPGYLSMQDIFLACHARFVQARPLGIDLRLSRYSKIDRLLARLDERASFRANPVWWWEPGVVAYEPDGTPVYRT